MIGHTVTYDPAGKDRGTKPPKAKQLSPPTYQQPTHSLFKDTHILQRPSQTLIILQQIKYLAQLELRGVLHFQKPLVWRGDLGLFLGWEDTGEVGEGLQYVRSVYVHKKAYWMGARKEAR